MFFFINLCKNFPALVENSFDFVVAKNNCHECQEYHEKQEELDFVDSLTPSCG